MGVGYGITNTQAKQLEGVHWLIDDVSYRFASRNGQSRGEQPWFAGAEGLAYPLLDEAGIIRYFAKFFKPNMATAKRKERMHWFIDQAVFDWAPELAAAPCRVLDTQLDGRPDGIAFDFCCLLSRAVPGMTWMDTKSQIMEGTWLPTDGDRARWVEHLVRSLAILERGGLCHGDISPFNVVVDPNNRHGDATLRLIDFDGFVASNAGALRHLDESEGGTIGTDGYCPPEFDSLRQRGESCVNQKSDRYARDMLILELVLYDGSWEFDEPVSRCDRDHILARVRRSSLSPGLRHLGRADVFESKQQSRPQSTELAQQLGLTLPPRRKHVVYSSSAPAPGPAAAWARTTIWSCCFGVWIVISFMFVRLLAPGTATGIAYMGQALVRVLLFVASVSAGGAFLTFRIVCKDRPQTYQIGGVVVELPRRRTIRRRPLNQSLRSVLVSFGLGVALVYAAVLAMNVGG